MADIKPIETYYNGYRFRSRLEARWAVFFDAMGIRYEYEHEGFERKFGNGEIIRYLPDFWFPEYRLFGEVKGIDCRGQLPKKDAEKMSWMIDFNGPCANGIIILGNIPSPQNAETMEWAIWKHTGKGIGYGYCTSDTPPPDAWDLAFIEYSESAPYSFNSEDDLIVTSAVYGYGENYTSRVEKALTKARQARFEYGETPPPPIKPRKTMAKEIRFQKRIKEFHYSKKNKNKPKYEFNADGFRKLIKSMNEEEILSEVFNML